MTVPMLLSVLGGVFSAMGALLIWIGLRLVTKVDKLTETINELKDDIVKNYRRKEDCRKCDPAAIAIPDLTSGVKKLQNDLETLTSDVEEIRKITGPELQPAV